MSRFITYIALAEATAVTTVQLVDRYRDLFGDQIFKIDITAGAGGSDDSIVLRLDKNLVAVMFIPLPLPQDAYEQALRLDQFGLWPEAREIMGSHKAHYTVAVIGSPDDAEGNLNAARMVTLVAGALVDLLPTTVALVFTEARTITRPTRFASFAKNVAAMRAPSSLWTSMAFFRGQPAPNGKNTIGVMSVGLLPFIGREMEFTPAPVALKELAERAFATAEYLILKGSVIKDGDTFGMSADEKIRVRYRDAGTRPGIPIIEMSIDRLDSSND